MTTAKGPADTISLHDTLGIFEPSGTAAAIPIHLIPAGGPGEEIAAPADLRWAKTLGFKGGAKAQALLPASIGSYQRTAIESTGMGAVGSEAEGTFAWNWARTIWADSLS